MSINPKDITPKMQQIQTEVLRFCFKHYDVDPYECAYVFCKHIQYLSYEVDDDKFGEYIEPILYMYSEYLEFINFLDSNLEDLNIVKKEDIEKAWLKTGVDLATFVSDMITLSRQMSFFLDDKFIKLIDFYKYDLQFRYTINFSIYLVEIMKYMHKNIHYIK